MLVLLRKDNDRLASARASSCSEKREIVPGYNRRPNGVSIRNEDGPGSYSAMRKATSKAVYKPTSQIPYTAPVNGRRLASGTP